MGQAASPSLYDFAGGDPINSFDPDGRCPNGGSGKPTPDTSGVPGEPAPTNGGQNPSDPNPVAPNIGTSNANPSVDANSAAQAAAATDNVGSPPAGYNVEQSWSATNGSTNAVLYRNPITGATILAYQGSTSFSDAGTDIYNAFGGESARYQAAVQIAQSVQQTYPNTVLTGVSLGGGEAALASVRTGMTAITFNAAGVVPSNYNIAGSTSQITNYHVATDALTLFQTVTSFPSALGNQVTLLPGNILYAFSPILAHTSASILSSLNIKH
jgi:hypothetical protein